MRFIQCSLLIGVVGCASGAGELADGVVVANLRDGASSFAELRATFRARNPGYDLEWLAGARALDANDGFRVAFVQGGAANAMVVGGAEQRSPVEVGAALALRPLERAEFDLPLDLVVFTVPVPFSADTPTYLRPDFDPRIDDQQGGCATEDKPYRRLLLTWRPENGPYVHHGINAHRVRIVDSFTHYHPEEGGFDEFYLVQTTKPGARLITSHERAAIEDPPTLDLARVPDLLRSRTLEADDLILLPRGVIHRGIGGAIVMVITIPGFRPGAEIGVDHHLRAIADRCATVGKEWVVEFHNEASAGPVVR